MSDRPPPSHEIPVAEVRDYHRINRELIRALDAGHRRIRLIGVGGQRLLVSGLRGPWNAVIEVDGNAGPELAADLDAPGVTVLGLGSVADGPGRELRAGRLVILGDVGDAAAAAMSGGVVIVSARAGHRAGLGQRGGTLILLGSAGRLACDRQSGGIVFADRARLGPFEGRGRRGGRLVPLPRNGAAMAPEDLQVFRDAVEGLGLDSS